jgi:3-hydroxyisobutyrate dehydrogenase-like beta-hydroxyacid dehydrogenase
MSELPSHPVGFIGAGAMGLGMVANLVKAGVAVQVFDIDPAASGRARDAGASVVASVAEMVPNVQVVFLCVPTGKEVRQLLFADDGIAAHANAGTAVIDHTTYNRDEAVVVAEKAADAGLRYADCPISGTPYRAADGSLTIMFGGEAALFSDASCYLNVTGDFVVHCGEAGTGQLMKAVNNIIYDVNIAAICEVLPLAQKAGLDPQVLQQVVTSGSSRSFASEYFVPKILDNVFDGDFTMNSAYKDIVNVQQAATRLGAMTPVVNAMIAVYQQAIAQGHGDHAKSSMIKLYEDALDTQFRNA